MYALGGAIGSVFGPDGALVGRKIGSEVAKVLNKKLDPIIDKGIELIRPVAKRVFEKGKELLKSVGEKLKKGLTILGIFK